jgi:hypothetical protein
MKEFKLVIHLKSSNKQRKVATFVACIPEENCSILGKGGNVSLLCCVQVGSGHTSFLSSGCRGLSREDKAVEASG